MRELRSEQEIMANWKGELSKPIVSVCCITYNHEPYIEDALEGFLIQETDFPFEIIVHDDASTDKTADIVREYAAAYPNIIKPILQTQNQYLINKALPFINCSKAASGGYIAICEGDDYWCDKNKLQIQAVYLNAHPEIVISGHDAYIIDDCGNKIKDSKLPDNQKRDFSKEELVYGKAWVLTMNWLYRNVEVFAAPEQSHVTNLDNFVLSRFGKYGGSHHHTDIKQSCYRLHGSSVWSSISQTDKQDSQLNTWFWMYRYYQRIGEKKYARHYWLRYLRTLFFRASLKDLTKECLIRILFLREQKRVVRWAFVKFGILK
jgi:glycosyltransferase involved in cell wall biosynthesis